MIEFATITLLYWHLWFRRHHHHRYQRHNRIGARKKKNGIDNDPPTSVLGEGGNVIASFQIKLWKIYSIVSVLTVDMMFR